MRKCFIVIIFIILLILVWGIRKINKDKFVENMEEIKINNITKLKNLTLITIYDNYQSNPLLKTGGGFSCLIKTKNGVKELQNKIKTYVEGL